MTPRIISGSLADDTILKMTARFIIGMFLLAPWVLFRRMVKSHAPQDASPYALMLLKGAIPGLMAGVSLFWFADMLNSKLGLLKMEK